MTWNKLIRAYPKDGIMKSDSYKQKTGGKSAEQHGSTARYFVWSLRDFVRFLKLCVDGPEPVTLCEILEILLDSSNFVWTVHSPLLCVKSSRVS
jgi:hypothetical protein